MADSITGDAPPTSFDKGINGFTRLMIKLMAVMVPACLHYQRIHQT